MVEQSASVTVKAPVQQVYALFTHFNDFPKFMRFVKEVTYYDEQRTHWVVHVLGDYEWDAVNEDWIPDQQIGWRCKPLLVHSIRCHRTTCSIPGALPPARSRLIDKIWPCSKIPG